MARIPGDGAVRPWVSLPAVRRALDDRGVRPSKGRGQNFLVHPETARRIAAAGGPARAAVEIGPGLGALTESLLDRYGRVSAVEIDGRLCEHLRTRFRAGPGFELVESDALRLDWARWLSDIPAPRALFGNLPYSISAALIEKIFQHVSCFSEAILCLQLEVAERIVSAGGRSMGPITLLAHRFCERRELLFRVGPGAFYPRPEVSSAIVRFVFRSGPVWTESDRRIPRRLFQHRRKKLSSVLPREVLRDLADAEGRPFADLRIDQLPVSAAALLYGRLLQNLDHST
ncbi:MAG: ribosomal RNA small subunit methyltransferase A [Candidatus Lindowbacteria bacterium RIFCSPLOWO2_12_FULL_62_27]|nr:MAG: ribosomal RNA small subunit methyltransferase A [Candidatus Lindowbacteria bacterium RIFCSPLOWO2_12_FULL_62_27]OGH63563.1 MAG: ribosomal RNA small subunit methyltransferase A [Candidatus Lindowbacteria bacterium RIFCSPLOWO2_02_FULL_62_12]